MRSYWRNNIRIFCGIIIVFVVIGLIDAKPLKYRAVPKPKGACPKDHYYDQESRHCKKVPCGGTVIHMDYKRRCSNRYLGIKVHPKYNQYYYICKPNSVVFAKCPDNQIFNSTTRHCVAMLNKTAEGTETECQQTGRFSTSSNCSLYYICDLDGKIMVKQVSDGPKNIVSIPNTQRCNCTHKCTPKEINPDDYFDDYDAETFPACKKPGRFRSPTDCSLYYTCSAKTNGKFYQTRYRCPAGTLYDIEKEKCLSKHRVNCEFVTIEDLISEYDKTHRYNESDVSEESSEYDNIIPSTTVSPVATTISPTSSTTSSPSFTDASNMKPITKASIDFNQYEGTDADYLTSSEFNPNVDYEIDATTEEAKDSSEKPDRITESTDHYSTIEPGTNESNRSPSTELIKKSEDESSVSLITISNPVVSTPNNEYKETTESIESTSDDNHMKTSPGQVNEEVFTTEGAHPDSPQENYYPDSTTENTLTTLSIEKSTICEEGTGEGCRRASTQSSLEHSTSSDLEVKDPTTDSTTLTTKSSHTTESETETSVFNETSSISFNNPQVSTKSFLTTEAQNEELVTNVSYDETSTKSFEYIETSTNNPEFSTSSLETYTEKETSIEASSFISDNSANRESSTTEIMEVSTLEMKTSSKEDTTNPEKTSTLIPQNSLSTFADNRHTSTLSSDVIFTTQRSHWSTETTEFDANPTDYEKVNVVTSSLPVDLQTTESTFVQTDTSTSVVDKATSRFEEMNEKTTASISTPDELSKPTENPKQTTYPTVESTEFDTTEIEKLTSEATTEATFTERTPTYFEDNASTITKSDRFFSTASVSIRSESATVKTTWTDEESTSANTEKSIISSLISTLVPHFIDSSVIDIDNSTPKSNTEEAHETTTLSQKTVDSLTSDSDSFKIIESTTEKQGNTILQDNSSDIPLSTVMTQTTPKNLETTEIVGQTSLTDRSITDWHTEETILTEGELTTTLEPTMTLPPFKNDTMKEQNVILCKDVINTNSSSLNMEDKSVETLNLHISNPMKLLVHFHPKLSCSECYKGSKTIPNDEIKEPKTIFLNF